jgi:hypothetical protein
MGLFKSAISPGRSQDLDIEKPIKKSGEISTRVATESQRNATKISSSSSRSVVLTSIELDLSQFSEKFGLR